jgi:hypothetical protein
MPPPARPARVRASFDLHAATPTIAVTTGRSVRVTPDRPTHGEEAPAEVGGEGLVLEALAAQLTQPPAPAPSRPHASSSIASGACSRSMSWFVKRAASAPSTSRWSKERLR